MNTNSPDNAAELAALEDRYVLRTYKKFPVRFVRGRDATVWDETGRAYLDFYGGHAVALAGHCPPSVVRALTDQAETLLFYSNTIYHEARARAAEALIGLAPAGFGKVFFCNSGAEANETAIKVARQVTGRTKILFTEGSFHGRTHAALSATGVESYRKRLGPPAPGFQRIPFGDVTALEKAVDGETAAVLLEPIQSLAGVNVAPPEFYRAARARCDAAGALLLFDEVQTGLGRTGRMWVGEHWGVIPDVITTAKGLASGLPAGAALVRSSHAESIGYGDLGSTFGGGPLVAAAIAATLDIVKDQNLADRARLAGERFRAGLADHRPPGLKGVRGLGLLIGLEWDRPAAEIQKACLDKGLVTGTSDNPSVQRLLPPLVITDEEVDRAVKVLAEVASTLAMGAGPQRT